MQELKFGGGKISISAGRRLTDSVLILEQNRGTGTIGEKVPNRPKGALIQPDEDSVVLSFTNAESVQVVIDELQNVKALFAEPMSEPDALRLQGAHEVLGIAM